MIIVPRTTANNIIVRTAKSDDAPAIHYLYTQLVADPISVKVDRDRIDMIANDPNNLLLATEYNGTVVATALMTICLDPMFGNQPFSVVENVVVENEHRNIGCGRALFDAIEQVALYADCSKIMLLSGESRSAAHKFFVSIGYQEREKIGFLKYRREFASRNFK